MMLVLLGSECMVCDIEACLWSQVLPSLPPDILGDTGAAAALKNELETAGHTLNEEFNSRLATMAQKHRCKRI